jgi:DNA repair protein RadC
MVNNANTSEENVHKDHRNRMWDKFLSSEGTDMPDHELLEMLLFYSRPRINTNDLAHELINRFGSLQAVFEANPDELVGIDQIGSQSAKLIKLVHALIRRYEKSILLKPKSFCDDQTAIRFFKEQFCASPKEQIMLLLLDNDERMIGSRVLSEGTVNSAPFNNRKIMETVLACKASSFYIAHNHPHGSAVPSDEDISNTLDLKNVCLAVDVVMKEHILIAGEESCGF